MLCNFERMEENLGPSETTNVITLISEGFGFISESSAFCSGVQKKWIFSAKNLPPHSVTLKSSPASVRPAGKISVQIIGVTFTSPIEKRDQNNEGVNLRNEH